jgi:hypothetical protein
VPKPKLHCYERECQLGDELTFTVASFDTQADINNTVVSVSAYYKPNPSAKPVVAFGEAGLLADLPDVFLLKATKRGALFVNITAYHTADIAAGNMNLFHHQSIPILVK